MGDSTKSSQNSTSVGNPKTRSNIGSPSDPNIQDPCPDIDISRKHGPALLSQASQTPSKTHEPDPDIQRVIERLKEYIHNKNAVQPSNLQLNDIHPIGITYGVSSTQKAEKGVTGFFKGLAKTFVSGVIGAALFPFFGPVVAAAATFTTLMATSIQLQLEPSGLHLQEDTINKLAEPLHGKKFDENDLRKVIEEVLSKDRPANEDLKQFFIDLVPTIQQAAKETSIHISGPVQGLIAGDRNHITQTFQGLLSGKS